jgi:hypothetical protein
MWNCHYERSEESAVVCGWDGGWGKEQIPHGLKAIRDDNSEITKPDITSAALSDTTLRSHTHSGPRPNCAPSFTKYHRT